MEKEEATINNNKNQIIIIVALVESGFKLIFITSNHFQYIKGIKDQDIISYPFSSRFTYSNE